MEPLGFAAHNHRACIKSNLGAAVDRCAAEGLNLTPVRRRVLEILLERHRAIGAYDILDVLRDEGLGSQPPVAYRALDFLVANGFAHRIEGRNAFIACAHPSRDHSPVFLICRSCDAVAETPDLQSADILDKLASKTGFRVERAVIEAEGLCPACSASEGTSC